MIVNVSTHECTTFTNSEGNIACKETIIMPDQLVCGQYCRCPGQGQMHFQYFKLDALMERIMEEGGISSITFHLAKGGRHDFAVTFTLIDDPSERHKNPGIFSCVHRTLRQSGPPRQETELLVSSQFDPLTHL